MSTTELPAELSEPLEVINKLLKRTKITSAETDEKEDDQCPALKHFEDFLKTQAATMIPSLNKVNSSTLPHNSLVRYRCMVTQQYDQEYYYPRLTVLDNDSKEIKWLNCKYRSTYLPPNVRVLGPEEGGEGAPTGTRERVHCVVIPGESNWVNELDRSTRGTQPESSSNSPGGDADDDALSAFASAVQEQQAGDPKDQEFVVKLYTDLNGGKDFKVADTYEVVGVLAHAENDSPSAPKETSAADTEKDAKSQATWNVGCKPVDPNMQAAMQFPSGQEDHFAKHSSIHVLHYKKIEVGADMLPVGPEESFNQALGELRAKGSDTRKEIRNHVRKEILDYISAAVGGDRLVSEYILANMVSTVYLRGHQGHTLGKIPLNITNCPTSAPNNPQSWARKMVDLYQSLLPQAILVNMTLEELNANRMVPVMNHETSVLSRGKLQVANHTPVIVDETCMQEGKLEETGLRNLKALKELLFEQKVNYDFQFHPLPFMTDAPMVVLSENNSLLCKDRRFSEIYRLKLNIATLPKMPQVPAAKLKTWRAYIAMAVAMDKDFGIGRLTHTEEVAKAATDAFAESRKKDPKKTGEWWLHNRMVLSRIIARTYLQQQVNLDHFTQALKMENEREDSFLSEEQKRQKLPSAKAS